MSIYVYVIQINHVQVFVSNPECVLVSVYLCVCCLDCDWVQDNSLSRLQYQHHQKGMECNGWICLQLWKNIVVG